VDAATPTTIYVDNGNAACSDMGSGTEAQPFCTINAAAKTAVPDDTVQRRGRSRWAT
jgi:hypothetical protein